MMARGLRTRNVESNRVGASRRVLSPDSPPVLRPKPATTAAGLARRRGGSASHLGDVSSCDQVRMQTPQWGVCRGGVRRHPPLKRARTGVALAVLLGLAWPVAAGPAQDQAEQPIIRARLEPEGSVVVGEPITLVVEVLTPTWFPRPPRFALPEVENAIAEEVPGAGFNLSERIGNASWAGLHREFRIYPQVPGAYVVPPATVDVVYALPDARPSDPLTLTAGELRFEARVPAAAAGLKYFISATRFELTQSVDPPSQGLKVGDALTRTITMTAAGSSSMMLPPMAFEPLDGLAVYPAPPRTADEGGERGTERRATRVESATYALQAEGEYTLPEVAVSWWDPGESALRTARLPAVSFHVEPNPNLAEEAIALPEEPVEETAAVAGAAPEWRTRWRELTAAVVLLALVAWGWRRAWWCATQAWRRLAAWRRARADGEAARFRRLLAAARAGDALATATALRRWLDAWAGGEGSASVAWLTSRANDAVLAAQLAGLEAVVYGAPTSPPRSSADWSGAELARRLPRARTRLGRVTSRSDARPALPSLNPPPTHDLP